MRRWLVAALVVVLPAAAASCTDDSSSDEPAAARALPALAWTGDELFVFGGLDLGPADFATDGLLVDPSTGETTPVPSLDLGDPIAFPQAVVVEREAFVIGQRCTAFLEGDACRPGTTAMAAFDLDADTWTGVAIEVPAAQLDATRYRLLGVTSDDRIVLRLGRDSFWTYDVDSHGWTPLPSPGPVNGSACLLGDTVVAVTAPRGVRGAPLRLFDLAAVPERWTVTDAAPHDSGPALTAVACSDTLALAFGPEAAPAVFHPGTGWRLTSPRPEGYLDNQAVAWTDTEFVFADVEFGARAQAYNPGTNHWRELNAPPRHVWTVVWTGAELIGTPWLAGDHPPLAHTPYVLDLS